VKPAAEEQHTAPSETLSAKAATRLAYSLKTRINAQNHPSRVSGWRISAKANHM